MKLSKLIIAAILSVSVASADDAMMSSMTKMDMGMNMIQKGFMHNNKDLVLDGAKMVEEGNKMFSKQEQIAKYLPEDKKHMVNVAVNQATRISVNTNEITDEINAKAYVSASNAYSTMLNACSRCHALVRNW